MISRMLPSALGLVFGLCACAGGGGSGEPLDPHGARAGARAADKQRVGRGLGATLLASVPSGTYGPYVARRGDARLLCFAELSDGKRRWKTLRINAQGEPMGDIVTLGVAANDIGLVALNPTPTGYALIASTPLSEGHRVDVWQLDAEGRRQSGPEQMAEVEGRLLWLDWTLDYALWAVRAEGERGDRADVMARKRGREGAFVVASDVRAWQTATLGGTVAVSVVRATGTALGPVDVIRLGDSQVATTTSVTAAASAEPDLDMVAAGDQFVLAWSDRTDGEPRVVTARVDAAGKLTSKPAPITPPRGEQSLIRLVSPADGGSRTYLVWEEALEQRAGSRTFRAAALTDRLSAAQATLSFESGDGGVPELVATASGLAALTLARPCKRGVACSEPAVTTFVELNDKLAVKTSTPLLLAPLMGAEAPLAWGLSCSTKGCLALAATDGAPADVFAVRFERAESSWQPASALVEREPPALGSVETIARTAAPLSQVALSRTKSAKLGAWLTYFDPSTPYKRLPRPAPDGRFDPPRAELHVARPGAEPTLLSFRARSLGGVALASDPQHGETLVAWTALDNQLPQLFVTMVDDAGKKLRQQMLTRSRGEKSDVAVVGAGDGFILAWIDERDGDPEVYAARVNRQLQRVGPDKRITKSKGSASGVALHAAGSDVWAAWSDAAPSPGAGQESLHLIKLAAADASAIGTPTVLDAEHSFGPTFAQTTQGPLLAWVASTPDGLSAVKLAVLTADGKVKGNVTTWRAPGFDATAAGVECDGDRCRLVALGDIAGRASVVAGLWTLGRSPGDARPLLTFGRAAVRSSRVALAGDELLVLDASEGVGRVRRIRVEWK
ncbi:MAG: hypothetical protein KF718_21025 [Polyangiaceae bacterium]|nr:hypothetical protein [Polyangiaceae bacterium]